jgi:2-iminobutanoate/2-iminopropanoate deaminase
MKEALATPDAPPALGPYSQGVKVNDMIFVSGQLPLDPRSGQIVAGGIRAQTEQVLQNLQAVLHEGEASLRDVVKVTIFLTDLAQFEEVNKVYAIFFPFHTSSNSLPPARATVEVSKLPKGVEIEMDAIAVLTHDARDLEIF